ncbi:putative ergosterol 28 [Nadsonia fulvescens var. elongata DSM 6958]|uniref:Putative ergosterol 28 n=1 Tax=Nadsonia fulvescens var. elongata DSM 6958 TaxID=857566 RepID=A0A1E3PLM0_9ASCO|nr:putative ergosterol 28 [Nadsonia fulvescens var. elongata DSM 6958]
MSIYQKAIELLPQSAGLLPKWLLFISLVSVFNSAQCYVSGVDINRRIYNKKPNDVTKLSSRTFGTWTLLSCVIRFYGAYYINDPHVYNITLASYLIAGMHFFSEWLVFRSANLGKGLIGPLIVASKYHYLWFYVIFYYYTYINSPLLGSTITWMTLQRDFYLPAI